MKSYTRVTYAAFRIEHELVYDHMFKEFIKMKRNINAIFVISHTLIKVTWIIIFVVIKVKNHLNVKYVIKLLPIDKI